MIVAIALIAAPNSASAQDQKPKKDWKAKIDKSLKDMKTELKDFFPKRIEKTKTAIKRLKIVRRPQESLSSYPDSPELWGAVIRFYDYIKGRELDVAAEQSGIPDFFPSRGKYYDFLDTILPAMRDRKFERNRVLEYRIHQINKLPPEGEGNEETVELLMSATSDDTLPFKKLIVYRHKWHQAEAGWYPGKIIVEPATYWERLR